MAIMLTNVPLLLARSSNQTSGSPSPSFQAWMRLWLLLPVGIPSVNRQCRFDILFSSRTWSFPATDCGPRPICKDDFDQGILSMACLLVVGIRIAPGE